MNGITPEHRHSNDGTSRSKSNPYKFNKLQTSLHENFSESFFGESHRYGLWNSLFPIYYNQLEVKISVFSTLLRG